MSSKPELLRHLINRFLEEEAFYNKMNYVRGIILEMKDNDHVVFTFSNESQFREIVNAAMKNGSTYVNVHIEQNPEGEVRGQLVDIP